MELKHIELFVLLILPVAISTIAPVGIKSSDVLVYTVATSDTDGYRRYLHSAERNNINPIVLGFGQEWKGGDNIKAMAGGGWKVNLLKEALKDHENDLETIVLFTDGYDVMFLSNINLIQTTFVNTGHRILFGAEAACWPDKSLSEDYPTVKGSQKRYLNSGMFIGYVPEIIKLLNRESIGNTDDDQLFFTHAYLDKEFREEVKMGLDIDSAIFQNLNGATTDVELTAPKDTDAPGSQILRNVFTLTSPMVVHGNGPSKLYLNSLSNYLAGAWNPESGCEFCKAGQMSMEGIAESKYPTVLLALFAEEPIPFIEEQLELVTGLAYPKDKIHFFIHNNVKYHSDTFNEFVEKHGDDYASMKQIKAEDEISEWNARDLSLNRCVNLKCDFYFSVDAIAHLDNPFTLKLLIEQNRTVVAPLLPRPGKAWSNFWGALTTDGYYARSADYMDIVHNHKRISSSALSEMIVIVSKNTALIIFAIMCIVAVCNGARGVSRVKQRGRGRIFTNKMPIIIQHRNPAAISYYDHKDGAKIVKSSHFEFDYMLGRKITFFCMATGYPRPEIVWFKDGIELYAHKFFQVHEWPIGNDTVKSKMEIDPTTQKDAGYYECQANNKYAIDIRGFRTDYVMVTY